MSLYFYHFRTSQGDMLPDLIGSEYESDEEAVYEAALAAADLLRGHPSSAVGGAFEIHAESGWLVETVPIWRH